MPALSTITLAAAIDIVAAENVPDPRNNAAGYGDQLALDCGNEVIADLITEQYNWKFNRAVATPVNLNGWQQDYPQPVQANGLIGWGEDCDICDINNPTLPKPLNWDGPITWMKTLTRTSLTRWRPMRICWMYNRDLSFGTWPGAGVTYFPLITTGQVSQNPIMNFIDANGNMLILTGFGTTGGSAPAAPASSAEGVTVNDGSCVWTVVNPTSQGFRVDWLPSVGITYQLIPSYQIEPPTFTTLGQFLTPIPDSYSRHFLRGLRARMYMASPNPGDFERGKEARTEWIKSLDLGGMMKQADKEQNAYGMQPITSPVESRWQNAAPFTADNPF